MKKETIELIVKVAIHYEDNSNRREAIAKAKKCVLSTSFSGGSDSEWSSFMQPTPMLRQ